MSRWRVNVPVGTSVFLAVEADSEDGAVDAANELMPGLCAQCSGWGQDYSRDEWEPDWDAATAEPLEDAG